MSLARPRRLLTFHLDHPPAAKRQGSRVERRRLLRGPIDRNRKQKNERILKNLNSIHITSVQNITNFVHDVLASRRPTARPWILDAEAAAVGWLVWGKESDSGATRLTNDKGP